MTTNEQIRARVLAHHAEEVARGEHDDECEWRAGGHFLCHCSKRRRLADGFTAPPGPLVFQLPLCPRCGREVDHDGDSFCCPECPVFWPDPQGDGEFTDDYGDLDPSPYDQPAAETATSRG